MDNESFQACVLREQYLRVQGLGDRLELMREVIDWGPFRPMVVSVYHDGTCRGWQAAH